MTMLLSYYGDDFTGSCDTMEAMTRYGIRAALFLDPPTPELLAQFDDLEAVGVAGVSRTMSPEQMDAELPRMFEGLRRLGTPIIHYKLCSTFDSSPEIGSIGRAIDVAQRMIQSPFVPLLVATPVLWRYCAFGNLFARSGAESDVFRLDRHPTMQKHPITPMHESDIRLHLAQQTAKRIGLFDLLQYNAPDDDELAARFEGAAQDADIVLIDVMYREQLARIGSLLWRGASPQRPLFAAGSSGIEHALTDYWRECGLLGERPLPAKLGATDQLLVISGSASPVTEKQINRAKEQDFAEVLVEPRDVIDPDTSASAIENAARDALALLEQGRSVIVHSACGPNDPRIARTLDYFHMLGYDDLKIKLTSGETLGEKLGAIGHRILSQRPLRRVCISGGDTSSYVVRRMGLQAVSVKGAFAPAMPFCRAYAPGSPLHDCEMIFKGGQTGTLDFFKNVLDDTP